MMGSIIPLGEWYRILPNVFSGCSVSSVHILHHLPFLCTWRIQWCAPSVVIYVVMVDDGIYQGLLHIGNLITTTPMG